MENTDHGTFTWNETHGGIFDKQVCPYGNDEGVPHGSKAKRYCGSEGRWMMYDGDVCIPEATHILNQFTEVYIISWKRNASFYTCIIFVPLAILYYVSVRLV